MTDDCKVCGAGWVRHTLSAPRPECPVCEQKICPKCDDIQCVRCEKRLHAHCATIVGEDAHCPICAGLAEKLDQIDAEYAALIRQAEAEGVPVTDAELNSCAQEIDAAILRNWTIAERLAAAIAVAKYRKQRRAA